MPLGPDDKKPARFFHTGLVGFHLRFMPSQRRLVSRAFLGPGFTAGQRLSVAAQFDVSAAAGHVGGDGHRARVAGLCDDLRFLFVVASVQDAVRDGPCHRHVGWDLQHLKLVDLGKLVRFGGGSPGHTGQLGIKPEVILESDRGEGLIFRLDGNVLLSLQCLMEPVRIAPAFHHAAGELIDNHHLVIAGDIIDIAREQRVRA